MVAGIFVTFGRRYGPPSEQPALPYLAATGLADAARVFSWMAFVPLQPGGLITSARFSAANRGMDDSEDGLARLSEVE